MLKACMSAGYCVSIVCAKQVCAGPITLVSLAKADPDTKLDVEALVRKLVPEYVGLLQQLKDLGVPEVLLLQSCGLLLAAVPPTKRGVDKGRTLPGRYRPDMSTFRV